MSGYDFNCTTHPVARKAHRCEECGRTIEPGEKYERVAAVWEGDFFTCVACAHCAAAREVIAHINPWYRESYYHGLDPWLSDLGHEDLASLRVYAGFRAKWRYQSGALMPLPQTPGVSHTGPTAA